MLSCRVLAEAIAFSNCSSSWWFVAETFNFTGWSFNQTKVRIIWLVKDIKPSASVLVKLYF